MIELMHLCTRNEVEICENVLNHLGQLRVKITNFDLGAKSLSTKQFKKNVMKIVGYQIILRITRFVTLVIRPDYQKFCLRSTPVTQYPVRWIAQSALHFLPSLADLFIPTPTRLLREEF